MWSFAVLLLLGSACHLTSGSFHYESVVRKNVEKLTPTEILNLQIALDELQADSSESGYQAIAGYHGSPPACIHNGHKVACCVHGMPTFPVWHRLYTVQMERALIRHKMNTGMPFWDWTRPLSRLPSLVEDPIFIDPAGGKAKTNAWHQAKIEHESTHTARAVDERLFEKVEPGHHTTLFEGVLDALEQEEFCQFEVQFEVNHNSIHFLTGGRYMHSMSTLEYTSYDPLFFLHHSNVDRIFAIWQELQKARGLEFDHSHCDVHSFEHDMEPFNRTENKDALTKAHAKADSTFVYHQLGYRYSDMTLNDLNLEQLQHLIDKRKASDRLFANFKLSGIGISANVRVNLCLPSHEANSPDHCEFAGDFFILGGPTEMPWTFFYPYFFDVTKTIHKFEGADTTSDFYVTAEVQAVNGTNLPANSLPNPVLVRKLGTQDAHHADKHHLNIRKNANSITDLEYLELSNALEGLKEDKTTEGFQTIAAFHGQPYWCPTPEAKTKFACCVHGMATFPHWHRLLTVQFENGLRRHGLTGALPYWDWTVAATTLPKMVRGATFTDPITGKTRSNTWFSGYIDEAHTETSRTLHSSLFAQPKPGHRFTDLARQVLLAFEQDNFCSFEVQFEVIHNLIHALVGGSNIHSMGSLRYTAYDPIFFLHHSMTDRIWAIWQELQKQRGKPYNSANCADEEMHKVLQPFGLAKVNHDHMTRDHSIPVNAFDYRDSFEYEYDNIEFNGLSIPQIEKELEYIQSQTRAFAGFMLHGIKHTAMIKLNVCPGTTEHDCKHAGDFYLLGDEYEMPWRYDRIYKHDITDTLHEMNMHAHDAFHVTYRVYDLDGTDLGHNLFGDVEVIADEGTDADKHELEKYLKVRKDVNSLTDHEMEELRHALTALQADKTTGGFETIAAYHGLPKWCPTPEAKTKYACCVHGMPTFPHWHRLLTVQFENGLRRHGYTQAVPYWDWTVGHSALPDLVVNPLYTPSTSGLQTDNPWYKGHIDEDNAYTTRSIDNRLFAHAEHGHHYTETARQVFLALEQEDYCSFEVQYEVVHNLIHALVGGNNKYSMGTLTYTAYDPIFFLHHSMTDKIWAVWQALQKYRGKAYNTAECAHSEMQKPLQPFGLENVNHDPVTKTHAIPQSGFDYKTSFGYKYDNLEFNGLTIPELSKQLSKNRSKGRTFATFMLQGVKTSAKVAITVCPTVGKDSCKHAGDFYLLGSEYEMPWRYKTVYKHEITDTLHDLHLHPYDSFNITYVVYALDGTVVGHNPFGPPTHVYESGTVQHDDEEHLEVRKNANSLTAKEKHQLMEALKALQADKSTGGFQTIAAYHGQPYWCPRPDAEKRFACCVHGMATFPHWHRLLTVQFENGLRRHGYHGAVPYWDWSIPHNSLPDLVTEASFMHGGDATANPWLKGHIDEAGTDTTRTVDRRLFEHPDGRYTAIAEQVFLALEQDDFCSFEVQYEIIHNMLHALVGGHDVHSMASLRYTAYDPIFYLHHSMTDKIWAIWQALQKHRGKPYNSADCALSEMQNTLLPFGLPHDVNPDYMTRTHAVPFKAFDYKTSFGYKYDNLEFNGLTIHQLAKELEHRHAKERVFAGFMLHGIKHTALIRFNICPDLSQTDCHFGGEFYLLGDEYEMPWKYDHVYKHDITHALEEMNLNHDDSFHIFYEVYSLDGTLLGKDMYGTPSIIHHRGTVTKNRIDRSKTLTRKCADMLTREEVFKLREAMYHWQQDLSVDGFQAIAEYHGLPARCPSPDAEVRWACCHHGMATFPHWHRLFVTQVEDALAVRGSTIGMPYWDWTRPLTELPSLVAEETYTTLDGTVKKNPFFSAHIAHIDKDTTRNLVPDLLFEKPEFGDHTYVFDAMIYALEQEDFCDFEVQYEIVHNAMHLWVGGTGLYSMAHLHYTAFDPIFYLHHSNTDRLWAVWQALQIRRGKSYEANCAKSLMAKGMKPFAFKAPLNNNVKTQSHAIPNTVYDYEYELGYNYDSLQVGGMNLNDLEKYIDEQKRKDRTFAAFKLSGIKTSANVDVFVNDYEVGTFAILGGDKEMPWSFDRPYMFEITDAIHKLGLDHRVHFTVTAVIKEYNGNVLDSSVLPTPMIVFKQGYDTGHEEEEHKEIRKNVDTLLKEEKVQLAHALEALQADKSSGGFQTIAAYHGQPYWCPSPDAENKFACCVHGMATFPHWHRLLTVQFENGLRRHGYKGALPYWDWIRPHSSLPDLVLENSMSDMISSNPWFKGHIDEANADTTRTVSDKLFEQPEFGDYTSVTKQVLLALEQDDFCSFEVQYEIAHNLIHALVGGKDVHSMASLRYTAYDPIFFLHHSMTDRIWAIWQELQKYRGKPYNSANCALTEMWKPLQPFGLSSTVNPDQVTRDHAVPFNAFDYKKSFGYVYDNLDFNGFSIPQLAKELDHIRSKERVFAGFLLHGIKHTAMVKFSVCAGSNCNDGGEFYILGDEYEMPWHYSRIYKYDITDTLHKMGLRPNDDYYISYTVFDVDGTELGTDLFGTPSVIHDKGSASHEAHYTDIVTKASHVRKSLTSLDDGEIESIRAAFKIIHDDGSYEKTATYHGYPGKCNGLACCVHGMPTFPHWHRLYVLQVESSLLEHGSSTPVPYWDWTNPMSEIPSILSEPTYYNSRQQRYDTNPFFSGKISSKNAVTSRDPMPELFNSNYFYENTLLAFEQDNFCDFEIQFEITHNAFHLWLGGKGEYSMSTLDFSAFDPAFFVYHANTDRLWAIWQELQRYRNKPYNSADCAINQMHVPLQPFDREDNPNPLTKAHNKPFDVFDYQDKLNYRYDTLEFNGMDIPQLENVLVDRQRRDRTFAGFLLHGIKTSAHITIYVCVPIGKGKMNCNNKAGSFSILGGPLEMPFSFDRLYKYDITATLHRLGIDLQSHSFDIKVHVESYSGQELSSDALGMTTIIFAPGTDSRQAADGHKTKYVLRKNINNLNPHETISLVKALNSMQADTSADGYQSIASFHALPPLCPSPAAAQRFACCVHGMATFPQWHRLYTVQFGESLMKHGSPLCIPYWDWTRPQTTLPDLLTKDSFTDPVTGQEISNPWKGAKIAFENSHTARDLVNNKLFPEAKQGYRTWYYDQVMLALEQENYCDFEIQFEILHNGVHLWMGGKEEHSMSHLHYTSYDPAFYIHHSETDRIWAIWQELQHYRGLDGNEANCALELMKTPLKPFNFGAPYNLNQRTKQYSRPADTFNYKDHFGYVYDSLEFMGMTIPMLDSEIKKNQQKGRIFAGFLLKGFGKSADVDFEVCDSGNNCKAGGYFSVLGGSQEMAWQFDRLYKYDITDVMHDLGLHYDDPYTFRTTVKDASGTKLDEHIIGTPSTMFVPGTDHSKDISHSSNSIRRDIAHLDSRSKQNLIASLSLLQKDNGADGFAAISSFHGLPAKCPDPSNPKHACCIHGMPAFPMWHRLYVRQFELAMMRHGSFNAVPYWDWTLPVESLPPLLTEPSYYDAVRDEVIDNPWARGFIPSENTHTVRDLQDLLYKTTTDGKHSLLFEQVLLALEQTDYCDFEVQYEVIHNWIHNLIGGRNEYSLSSLHWTSYDPLFYIHHSFVDKLFAVWQELQKRRNLPHDRADCAINSMNTPMHPFNMDINANAFTKAHALPSDGFDYAHLGYTYDNLNVGGMSVDELEHAIENNKQKTRVFAGFLLYGIGSSAEVEFKICKTDEDCYTGGFLFILGGQLEMPWAFDRLFKYDITDALERAGLDPRDVFNINAAFHLKVEITDVVGKRLPDDTLPAPTIIYEPAEDTASSRHSSSHSSQHKHYGSSVGVRKDIDTLTPKEMKNLRKALAAVQADTSHNGYQAIASYHGSPPICKMDDGTKMSCCIHGMATFPHWHRLYVKQMEDALVAHGATVGIPYWDWTKSFTHLPAFVTEEKDNPFHHGKIEYLGQVTTRDPRPQLFSDPEKGEESFFYRQMLLALEQTDFCSFEVQFEVTHNAIHSWTGGRTIYGMSTLDFTSYDPLFYVVHSSVDRIWAIWQALQRFRGLPYNEAYCEIQELKEPLRPFSDDVNPNTETRKHSVSADVFNYHSLNYQYDDLDFHGMSISELEDVVHERITHDRVFVDFLLTGFKKSADVEFDICTKNHEVCKFAGTFAILGGPHEMPWAFDRLFHYDVTSTMDELGLRYDSDVDIVVRVFGIDGKQLDSSLIRPPTMEYLPGRILHVPEQLAYGAHQLYRKEIHSLTLHEISELRNALYKMQSDGSKFGFEHIAGFHGAPYLCPEHGDEKYACCMHGMAVFPHWHRLFTVQFERALVKHGSTIGIPYWDWTKPFSSLPSFFSDSSNSNPFFKASIANANANTLRDPQGVMFNSNHLYKEALEVLGEDNYCDFEVQYEILHNELHLYIGGSAKYSMSTLEYSAYDPFFMIHHATIDRLWVIWQQLQRLRNKPFNTAPCAGKIMNMPLHPFSYPSVNGDDFTLKHSHPDTVFDQEEFNYWYDSLNLHDESLNEILSTVHNLRHHQRIYAGFVLSGLKNTVAIDVWVVNSAGVEEKAGVFYVFGGEKEIPWAYERIYKMDITDAVTKLGMDHDSVIGFRTTMSLADGTPYTGGSFPDPVVVYRPANSDQDILIIYVGSGKNMPPKISVKYGTNVEFHPLDESITSMIDLGSYTTFYNCVVPPFGFGSVATNKSYRLEPGHHFFTAPTVDKCKNNEKIQIHVDY